jgi:hypothetical protein
VTPLAQGLAQEGAQLALPRPHGFMRKDEAPLEKHFRQVSQAQLIPEAPQDDQADDISRILQPIEGCACPFIEDMSAVTTAKATIAQLRLIRAFARGHRLTVGTPHLTPSFQRGECIPQVGRNQGGVKVDTTERAAKRAYKRCLKAREIGSMLVVKRTSMVLKLTATTYPTESALARFARNRLGHRRSQ